MLSKNLTQHQAKELSQISEIQITSKVKYLGIYLMNRLSSLYWDSYEKALKEIGDNLENWESLQLSLLGRIAIIKVNVLPKLLFLFQVIPIPLKESFFIQLNQKISKFVWKLKKKKNQ